MKNKGILIAIFIILALPIPISLITILGSIVSFANIGEMGSVFEAVVASLAMFFSGTYTVTYIASLILAICKPRLKISALLPIIHIILAIMFIMLWSTL